MRLSIAIGVMLLGLGACGPKRGSAPSTEAPSTAAPRARERHAPASGARSTEPTPPADPTSAPTLPSVVDLASGDASFVGRVLDQDGNAWAGVTVIVAPDCAEGTALQADASGNVSVRGLSGCPTTVFAIIEGASHEIRLEHPGNSTEITLRPRCTGDIILLQAAAAVGPEPTAPLNRPVPPRRVPCPERGRDRARSG